MENRRRELLESVRLMRDQKRKVLRDQMEVIDAHRKRQHILFFFFALLTFLFSLMFSLTRVNKLYLVNTTSNCSRFSQ